MHINNFIMDYNQFSYYRANPYAKQGYMPPTAFINRHKPNFVTELPMGEEHLGKIGRKQYANNAHKSHIETDNILKSPERYPYENRIALDKHYERNLNTIDIEGATGGTLMSQAVRNKLKAREELFRRQEAGNLNSGVEAMKNAQTFQQQKRRKIAYTQFIRDQQLKKSENKLRSSKGMDNSTNSNKWEDNQKVETPRYHLNNRKNDIDHIPLIKARHQSIDLAKLRENQNGKSYAEKNYRNFMDNMGESQPRKIHNFDNQPHQFLPRQLENREASIERPKSKEAYSELLAKDRKSLRYQNPTNLSSEGSIHYAARSIIQGQ